MSAKVRTMTAIDEYARRLGYWILLSDGFLVHRFDELPVRGYACSTPQQVRDHLEPIRKLPRWRLKIDDNPMVTREKYGVIVTDEDGRRFCAPAKVGEAHIYMHAAGPPPIGNWESCVC